MNRWSTPLRRALSAAVILGCTTAATAPAQSAETPPSQAVRAAVDAVIRPLMTKDRIPGMAVAVSDGAGAYVFTYGVASLNPRVPVTGDTLFEIGSVTKTFTATLASWARVQHRLSFADTVASAIPELRGSPFGNVTLLNLGTHTPGGLALQFPDTLTNDAELVRYFQKWRPSHAAGTVRTYSNQSIGMLGFITEKRLGGDFRTLMEQRLFPALGLTHTFIDIPARERAHYAWGYDDNAPIRMKPGILWEETYGVRTTAADLLHFVRENIDPSGLSAQIQAAIVQTHTGYFRDGSMTQDLIWEQYAYPVTLTALLAGNSYETIFQPTPVTAIDPPLPPSPDAWLNKTGSTNGFAAYVAFVPSKRLGIVLLANRNYPIPDRVTAAYRILRALQAKPDVAAR